MIFHERRTGLRSSGLMFVFWLAMVVYGSFKLRTLTLIAEDDVSCVCVYTCAVCWLILLCSSSKQNGVKDKFRFTTFVLQFTTYIVEFFLVFIPEPRAFRVRAEEADVS